CDGRVAGPVFLRAGAPRTLRLVPGGYVVVLPRGAAWAHAKVEVARADGAPVLRLGEDRTATNEDRTTVAPGAILGPFEPGTVEFDVYAGGARWKRSAVTIRAGQHTPLPIGPLGE